MAIAESKDEKCGVLCTIRVESVAQQDQKFIGRLVLGE